MIFLLVQLPYGDNGRADDHDPGKANPVLDEAEDEAADVELPPPMKPIQVNLYFHPTIFNLLPSH